MTIEFTPSRGEAEIIAAIFDLEIMSHSMLLNMGWTAASVRSLELRKMVSSTFRGYFLTPAGVDAIEQAYCVLNTPETPNTEAQAHD